MTDIENAGAGAPAPEPAASSTATEAPASTTERSSETFTDRLEADLSAAYDKLNNPSAERDESGRFKSKVAEALADAPDDAEATETETQDQSPTEGATEPAKPAIEAPTSWSADMKAEFAALPPKAQEYIAQREREAAQQISRYGQEVSQLRGVKETVEAHRDLFERNRVSYKQGVESLLRAQRLLDENPVRGIAFIAQTYGVDLHQLVGEQAVMPGQSGVPLAVEAKLAALEAKLSQTEARDRERQQAEQNAQLEAMQSLVDDFAKQNPDFALVEDDVVKLIPIIRERNPALSHKELLAKALDEAGWVNPTVRAKRLEKEAKKLAEAEAKKQTEAKRIAALNVKSNSTARPGPKTIMDTLEATYDRIVARG